MIFFKLLILAVSLHPVLSGVSIEGGSSVTSGDHCSRTESPSGSTMTFSLEPSGNPSGGGSSPSPSGSGSSASSSGGTGGSSQVGGGREEFEPSSRSATHHLSDSQKLSQEVRRERLRIDAAIAAHREKIQRDYDKTIGDAEAMLAAIPKLTHSQASEERSERVREMSKPYLDVLKEAKKQSWRIENVREQIKQMDNFEVRSQFVETASEANRLSKRYTLNREFEEAQIAMQYATICLDFALSVTPVVGLGRDIFEAITGRDILSGEDLGTFGRSMAILGVVTAGFGSKLGKALSFFKRMMKGEKAADAVKVTENIVSSAKSIGIDHGEKIKSFGKWSNEVGGTDKAVNLVEKSTKQIGISKAGEFLHESVYKGSFPNKLQSLAYHHAKHGKGRTPTQYIKDAKSFFTNQKHQAKAHTLMDGTPGLSIKTKNIGADGKTIRQGGFYKEDGRVVTYWD